MPSGLFISGALPAWEDNVTSEFRDYGASAGTFGKKIIDCRSSQKHNEKGITNPQRHDTMPCVSNCRGNKSYKSGQVQSDEKYRPSRNYSKPYDGNHRRTDHCYDSGKQGG